MTYEHKQTAPVHLVFVPLFAIFALVAWQSRGEAATLAICLMAIVIFAVVVASFAHLVVKDGGDHLIVHFGPLPLFTKRIRYRDIESAEPGRSLILDGWGIHYFPGRGWTYNLWGFDCVELRVRGRRMRVGSDDVPQLVAFLRTRIG